MIDRNDTYVQLVADYGLSRILEQNDIEEWEALRFLFEGGFLDINEYVFSELILDDED